MRTRLSCQWGVNVPWEKVFERDVMRDVLMRMDILITSEIPSADLQAESPAAQWMELMSTAQRTQLVNALEDSLILLLPSTLRGEELQRNLHVMRFEQLRNRSGRRFTLLWNYPRMEIRSQGVIDFELSELVAVSRTPNSRLYRLKFKHSAFLAIKDFVDAIGLLLSGRYEYSVILWCSLGKEGDELSCGIHSPEEQLRKAIAELDALFIGTVTRNSPQWQLLEILRDSLGALVMIEHLPSRAIADAMYSGLFEAMGAGDVPVAEWRYIKRCAYESAQGHTEASQQESQ